MNKQRSITLVLLISLAIASGPSVTHTSAAAPVLSEVEGPALSSVPSDVLSLSKGLSRGQVEGPDAPIEHGADTVTLPEDVSPDWWTTVQEDIRQSEYHVTWQDHTYLPGLEAAYQAPNRAQDLRTYFTPTGIRVIPRTPSLSPSRERGGSPAGAGGDWEWGLSLTGYGYAGDIRAVDAAELSASANRIEYRRGDIVEWYLNDEQGLEQGFTISRQPSAVSSQPSTIVLDLAIGGNLAPALVDEGQAIEFTTSSGEAVLRYANLRVTDATGRQLPAHFSILHSQISILVDTTTALYPITVDPTITGLSPTAPTGLSTSADWMAESDQASANFGISVSTAGDVNGDGYADVVVGARKYDNGQTDEGRAYVYHGSASGLITTTAWFTESNQIDAYFGASVGTAGDVNGDGYSDVIVGAYRYDNPDTDEGRAYVYHGSASGLITTTAWFTEGNQIGANFGISVSTAGDVNGDGYSDVIVGAQGYDNGEDNEGRAYVYHGSATGLSTTADWTAESDQADAYFGVSVGTAGDVNGDGYADVIVGASFYDGVQTDEGRAYVYHGSATGLSATADWTADESDQYNARFGNSVGTAGDVNGDGYADVIVGAYLYDHGHGDEGRAYVYHGSATGLSASADWTAESDQLNGVMGGSVGTAGDVNGDGYADVIVGAYGYDHPTNEGAAFAWHGSATGLGVNGDPTNADWMAESNQDPAYFGISVSTAGDVNGDGYADVIVGAHMYDNGQTDEGAAFVYYGNGGDGLDLLPRQLRTDGLVHIAPLGMSDSPTAVQLRLTGRMPLGREDVKLQWQVAPLGTPFTATTVISGTSATWTDVLTTGVVITQNVTGLTPFTPYHWRVRLLYQPGNRLGQPAGRWVHIPWNGWAEQDFRTPEEPIAGLTPTNDSPTELGEATTLTATITAGSNVAYAWAFGDGDSGSGAVVTHTYPAVGVYTATITATNSVDIVTATTTVTITDVPIMGLSAVNDSPTALGNATTLTATITAGSNVTYTWDFGDGTPAGAGAMVTHIYPAVDVYTATVTATNSVGFATASTIVIVEYRIYLPLVLRNF